MVKAQVVIAKLARLEERVDRVRQHARSSSADLAADRDAVDIVTLNLMLAVQSCLDIASHIIADEGWRSAASLGESIERLAEHEVIGRSTADALKRAAGLRNIVVHAYDTVRPDQLFAAATTGLADLDAFAREVSRWLATRPGA